MNRQRLATIVLFLMTALAGWRIVLACAPTFAVAVFHFSRHPDFPRSRFLNGHLGVLQPTWARSYLVISWRYLTGIGLDAREKQQAEDYYKDRDTGWWDKTGNDWLVRWNLVRDRVSTSPRPPKRLLTSGKLAWNAADNSFDLNCAEDSFRNAANTLEAHIGRFGARSRAVREWTIAQDQVFSNCDGSAKVIPVSAPADLPALIQDDRRYQIAAAHFYSGSLAGARDEFTSISRDSNSQWQTISRYLVVRTLLRWSSQPGDAGLRAGAALLQEGLAILADPKLSSIHAMTANLLNRNGLSTGNQNYLRRLATLVASHDQGNGLREGLWNYTTQYDRLIGKSDPNDPFSDPDAPKPDPAPFEADDMTAWIFHFQSRNPASGSYALDRWKRTGSLPWLLAALRYAEYDTASRNGLLEAARAVTRSSPAYETAAWHYYRLLLDGKDKATVREGIDTILASGKLTASSSHLFRTLRMSAATNLTDFLAFAARRPLLVTINQDSAEVGHTWDNDSWTRDLIVTFDPKLKRFDRNAAEVINYQIPLSVLRDLAFKPGVPSHLQRELLLVALTRALMLGRDMADIASKLGESDPSLVRRAHAIAEGSSDESRRFAAAHMILWQPEAKPFVTPGIPRQTRNGRLDDYRDNWWCPAYSADSARMRGVPGAYQGRYATRTPQFLTAADLEQAASEREALITTGRAMDFLGGIVLSWAKKHPDDPRVPEALHREIRGNRITCDGERETKINREAFRLLHSRYRSTKWARKQRCCEFARQVYLIL